MGWWEICIVWVGGRVYIGWVGWGSVQVGLAGGSVYDGLV